MASINLENLYLKKNNLQFDNLDKTRLSLFLLGLGLFTLALVTANVSLIHDSSDAYTFDEDPNGVEDGFKYYLDKGEGNITIEGYVGDSFENFVIPSTLKGYPVTKIADYAFNENTWLMGSLTIPDSVTYIGDYSFYGCKGFTGQLIIPDNVTYIGYRAFGGCTGFTGDLFIPSNVKEVGGFEECTGFTGRLIISDGVERIGLHSFKGCTGFKGDLILPDSVIAIGTGAFSDSQFDGSLKLPKGITVIDQYTFSGCSGFTGNLVIPENVKTIWQYAFSGCSGFTGDLIIPDGMNKIEMRAFFDCAGFTGKLTIPGSVVTVGSEAFTGCVNINFLCFESKTVPSDLWPGCFGFGVPGKKVNCTILGLQKGELHFAYDNDYTSMSYGTGSEHTVRYDVVGGSQYKSPINVLKGDSFIVPTYSGTKDGYNFVGWIFDETVYKPNAKVRMGDSDMLLKAVWEPVGDPSNSSDGTGSNDSSLTSTLVVSLILGIAAILFVFVYIIKHKSK